MTADAPTPDPRRSPPRRSRWRRGLSRFGRDLGYIVPTGPLALIAGALVIVLALVGAVTAVIWIGVLIGAGALWLARVAAALERARLGALTRQPWSSAYRPAKPGWRGPLTVYTDPQVWRDAAHAVLAMPLALTSWIVTIVWLSIALGGLATPFWYFQGAIEGPNNDGVIQWWESWWAAMAIGVIALVTLPLIARGFAFLHRGLGTLLLRPTRRGDLRAEVERLAAATEAAAQAEQDQLRRLERDLHDGPQQQLIRLAMDIERAQRSLEKDPERARQTLTEARDLAVETLADLRALSRGVAPALLVEKGLADALESLAEKSPVPVVVEIDVAATLPLAVESTAYFVVAEALTNVAKHAGATRVRVSARQGDGVLTVTVEDDGVGGASAAKGHGLAGLADRLEGMGGTLAVSDADPRGTRIAAEVPCADRSR